MEKRTPDPAFDSFAVFTAKVREINLRTDASAEGFKELAQVRFYAPGLTLTLDEAAIGLYDLRPGDQVSLSICIKP